MIKLNEKEKKVISKKQGSVRQKYTKALSDMKYNKKYPRTLLKEYVDKDLELNSRLKKLHEFQMMMLDEKAEINVRYAKEKAVLNTEIKGLKNTLDEKQAELRKVKAGNEELKLRLEALNKRDAGNKSDKKELLKALGEEFKVKEKLLILERANAIKDLENKLKNNVNRFKDAIYKKDLELAELAGEISNIKRKNQSKIYSDKETGDARIEQALAAVNKENEDLKNTIKGKETEIRKLKEILYMNENTAKKLAGSKNVKTDKIKKEFQSNVEELTKKFKKEKELLEQYLKTAKEETEKLKKEISIKNILSDL